MPRRGGNTSKPSRRNKRGKGSMKAGKQTPVNSNGQKRRRPSKATSSF